MKTLIFNGSPRKNGNTEQAINNLTELENEIFINIIAKLDAFLTKRG